MLQKLALPPGLKRIGTVYEAMGRWYDADKVRWHEGSMQPIGGYSQRTTSAMTGMGRAAIAWVDNSNLRYIVVGTHSKLYVFTQTATTPTDITPAGFTAGDADATAGAGYGIGPYGSSTYGTPRVDNATIQPASMWTLDTFGQVLYGMMAEDSGLYKWTPPDTGTVAQAVAGAPAGSAVCVTPERFIFVLGADGDNRKVRWADQESDSQWTAAASNQAGDFTIETNGKLMCGKRIRGGTLIWTDADVHLATYIAQPFIYRFDRIGENCGIASRGAAVVADTRAIWMGLRHFYAYDGVMRELPCEVHDGVFGDFNTTQRSKVVAFHNSEFSEVWWFYPSANSTEIDRYVAYNYAEGHWNMGTMARTAAIPRGVFNNPIMVDTAGDLWDHETGSTYDGDTPYAETGPIELGNGDQRMRVRRVIADEKTSADVTVTFKTRNWPNGSETSYGPYSIANPTTARFSGRQVRLRVDGSVATAWRWGVPRLELQAGGKR